MLQRHRNIELNLSYRQPKTGQTIIVNRIHDKRVKVSAPCVFGWRACFANTNVIDVHKKVPKSAVKACHQVRKTVQKW